MVTIKTCPVRGGRMHPAMTSAEARDRIEEVRIELRKCMRSVSVPDVDWDEADKCVAGAQELLSDLRAQTLMKALEDK